MMVRFFCKECSFTGMCSDDLKQWECPVCGAKASKQEIRSIRYRHLTPGQRIHLCNGCGGKGGIVKPPHAEKFKRLCDHHDFNYFLGFRWTDRFKADLQLFFAMLHEIWLGAFFDETDSFKFFKRLYYSAWSVLYYFAVVCVGWKFFYYGDREQEVPNV